MKNQSFKIWSIIIIFSIIIIMPLIVLASDNEKTLIIKNTDTNQYIVYIKDFLDKDFSYAVSAEQNPNEDSLNFLMSSVDGEGNHIAIIDAATLVNKSNYLVTKDEEDKQTIEIDFSKSLNRKDMEYIENTTKRIKTETTEKIVEKDEDVNGVKTTLTVGGLKIAESQDAKYYYEIHLKTENEEYAQLFELANEMNNNYEAKDMYTKLDIATQFYNLYNQLMGKAQWKEVSDMEIKQPSDAVEGDQYVVLIKKVIKNGNEEETTTDLKLMTSKIKPYEKKQNKEQIKRTQITSKLPITGESIILFVILAAIIIVMAIIYIRIKRLKQKENK